ncbi:hypothetical protein SDC9_204208 [bioreactor metagenome]|uniref:Uncharacterized protein n=1 Tax=bioreactor metagenome TaxID=1076179 RepID=A0A645IYM7_9ZZZZ
MAHTADGGLHKELARLIAAGHLHAHVHHGRAVLQLMHLAVKPLCVGKDLILHNLYGVLVDTEHLSLSFYYICFTAPYRLSIGNGGKVVALVAQGGHDQLHRLRRPFHVVVEDGGHFRGAGLLQRAPGHRLGVRAEPVLHADGP